MGEWVGFTLHVHTHTHVHVHILDIHVYSGHPLLPSTCTCIRRLMLHVQYCNHWQQFTVITGSSLL